MPLKYDPNIIRLETERLILRLPGASDFDAWAEFMAHEESARFIGGAQEKSASWRSFATLVGAWQLNGFSMFSMIEKATGKWVGRLGPWQPHGWPGTEVGWGLHPSYVGRGYATEGARAAIDWAFQELKWTEIIHIIDPENLPSKAVAERLGSKLLRHQTLPLPLPQHPMEIWGQSREEWYAHNS